ncbi:uncharacterized protein [Nicotiana sylvestris]|uniref:uncharacterized protein n=1 Tax=Nicotiana sylvestris TaxID=4096 RepID=UPI00388C8620
MSTMLGTCRHDKGTTKRAQRNKCTLAFCCMGNGRHWSNRPTASNGHQFILVAIDYFMKWVEVASYKAVTKKVIANFVKDRIICRFGVPESIITDNAANLNSDLTKAMCETFKIKQKNSIAYRPQMNGVVEAANKNIKKILRQMVENHKKRQEKLPFAYWDIAPQSAHQPGQLPIFWFTVLKLSFPPRRKKNEHSMSQLALSEQNVQSLQQKGQTKTICTGAARAEADLPASRRSQREIFTQLERSLHGSRVLIGGALILAEMDGEVWPKPINLDAVKRYYA